MPSSSSNLSVRVFSFGLAAAFGLLLVIISVYYFANRGPEDERELRAITRAMERSLWDMQTEIHSGGTQSAARTAHAKHKARVNDLAARCLALAEAHPDSPTALSALFVAVSHSGDSSNGRKAAQAIANCIPNADLAQLAASIRAVHSLSNCPEIAPRLLEVAKRNPDGNDGLTLLIAVCKLSHADPESADPAPEFSEAADLILAHHSSSPKIVNFCESVAMIDGARAWSVHFERHLRTILDKNQERSVRCAALFALASVVDSAGDRNSESRQLYSQFVTEFDGQQPYHYQQIEQMLNQQAKTHLEQDN
jgi:hypothetical protein